MIATAIREKLERATAAAVQGRTHADPTAGGVPDGPLRVLKIRLRPDDLGVVTLEVQLSNGQFLTHPRASQSETATLLREHTAIHTDLLSHGSYQAGGIVGQARSAEASTASDGSQFHASPSFNDGARAGNEGTRQQQDEQRQAGNRRKRERTDEVVRLRESGIYL